MSDTASTPPSAEIDEQTRRDFLLVSTATVGAVGTALSLWPFVNSLNPAADTLALATTENGYDLDADDGADSSDD
mgnify:CR=1 FL=1